jgi:hypothetical protein
MKIDKSLAMVYRELLGGLFVFMKNRANDRFHASDMCPLGPDIVHNNLLGFSNGFLPG